MQISGARVVAVQLVKLVRVVVVETITRTSTLAKARLESVRIHEVCYALICLCVSKFVFYTFTHIYFYNIMNIIGKSRCHHMSHTYMYTKC